MPVQWAVGTSHGITTRSFTLRLVTPASVVRDINAGVQKSLLTLNAHRVDSVYARITIP